MKTILFDMDDTLAAYHQYVKKLVPYLDDIQTEEDYEKLVVDEHFGGNLFLKLDTLPLYDYFIKWVDSINYKERNFNIAFVSFVGNHKHYLNSINNKIWWLEKTGLIMFGNIIPLIGKYEDRALLSNENTLLFDDDEYTVRLFRERKGQAVLVDPYEEYSNKGEEKFKTIINNFLRT